MCFRASCPSSPLAAGSARSRPAASAQTWRQRGDSWFHPLASTENATATRRFCATARMPGCRPPAGVISGSPAARLARAAMSPLLCTPRPVRAQIGRSPTQSRMAFGSLSSTSAQRGAAAHRQQPALKQNGSQRSRDATRCSGQIPVCHAPVGADRRCGRCPECRVLRLCADGSHPCQPAPGRPAAASRARPRYMYRRAGNHH